MFQQAKLMNIANECENCEIKNIFVSGLTINKLLHLDFTNALINALKLDCVKYGYNLIKNCNILPDNLW